MKVGQLVKIKDGVLSSLAGLQARVVEIMENDETPVLITVELEYAQGVWAKGEKIDMYPYELEAI